MHSAPSVTGHGVKESITVQVEHQGDSYLKQYRTECTHKLMRNPKMQAGTVETECRVCTWYAAVTALGRCLDHLFLGHGKSAAIAVAEKLRRALHKSRRRPAFCRYQTVVLRSSPVLVQNGLPRRSFKIEHVLCVARPNESGC